MRREDAPPEDPPTIPPTDAELEALARFELMVQTAGEADARYSYISERLDELLLHPAVE